MCSEADRCVQNVSRGRPMCSECQLVLSSASLEEVGPTYGFDPFTHKTAPVFQYINMVQYFPTFIYSIKAIK
jgi:hypothetical protein